MADIFGDGTRNTLFGTVGADLILGFGDSDSLWGGTGSAVSLVNDFGDDTIRGGLGNDIIVGGGGNDQLFGDEDDDNIIGNSGSDILHGGSGSDTLRGGSFAAIGAGVAIFDTLGLLSFYLGPLGFLFEGNDTLFGDEGDDQLQGSQGADKLDGGTGADTLIGGNDELYQVLPQNWRLEDAGDTLDGGTGADSMSGGTGNDIYVIDTLADVVVETGNDANDELQASLQIAGLYANIEHYSFAKSTTAITLTGNSVANRTTGSDFGDSLAGAGGNDTIIGGSGADTGQGGGDNDVLSGGLGADNLYGDDGNDSLDGGGDGDALFGGAGNDTMMGAGGNNTVTGGVGDDLIDVFWGVDVIRYTDIVDGHDTVTSFNGNAFFGQDVIDFDALFDALNVNSAERAARVAIADNGTTVDVRVDADGNAGNGFELLAVTLNTLDTITIGQDVQVGS